MKDSKLKIFAIPSWYPSKNDRFSGIFIKEHLLALKQDCEIIVLYVSGIKNQNSILKRDIVISDGITEVFFYFKIFDFLGKFLGSIYKAFFYILLTAYGHFYLIKKHGIPNLYHVHVLSRVAIIPLIINFFFRTPFLISEQYTRYLPEDGRYPHNKIHHFLTKLIVSKASGLTAISSHLLESMNKLGLISNYQRVISNVLNEAFVNQTLQNTVSKESKLKIVHVSTLNQEHKNIEGIIKALADAKKAGLDFCFDIYGGYEPYFSDCKKYASRFPEIEISFHGIVSKDIIAHAVSDADVSIVFSNYETQGCVVFESLAVGTPVIASNLPAIAEILNPQLGVLVESRDVESLTTAILNFTSQKFDTQYLRNYALEKYSQNTIKSKFLRVYHHILKPNV
jgi:glycosyltransferase involved in cell wall biosynthesis